MDTVQNIRDSFLELNKARNSYAIGDKNGSRVLELIGVNFLANQDTIFGKPDANYIQKELDWYESESRNVYDMPNPPQIWKDIADSEGNVNSNYGWCIYSTENYRQYLNVVEELNKNPFSRRAVMIYNRPSMHYDYAENGRNDFICTNTVQYLIRQNAWDQSRQLIAIVNMRSNDVVFGYRNDFAWQKHVLKDLASDLSVQPGKIYWQVGSLHIYERHWWMMDCWEEFNLHLDKKTYDGILKARDEQLG